MLIPDHETAVDFLNYEAVAKTVVALLKENREHALTIGIHGDWGAGKSSVARILAEKLGWNWIDADASLEERYGQSIRQVFEEGGEAEFRPSVSPRLGQVHAQRRVGDGFVVIAHAGLIQE